MFASLLFLRLRAYGDEYGESQVAEWVRIQKLTELFIKFQTPAMKKGELSAL